MTAIRQARHVLDTTFHKPELHEFQSLRQREWKSMEWLAIEDPLFL